jgi:hypothetical protein
MCHISHFKKQFTRINISDVLLSRNLFTFYDRNKMCLIKPHAVKTYGGVEVQLHVFFTPELGESYVSGIFSSSTHWIGAGWAAKLLWTVA